ncbi:MAG TPA: DoxX family protein [Acidimicrobiales bacterium]|jgi:putative oxidoreductase|nr:DoxX family protein [Acidimicrobiales bacterium]
MTFTRNLALVAGRGVLGGYLGAHGAQKLFGSLDGPGIEAASAGFHRLGLRPGPVFARIAAVSELGGGILTVAGAADPLGPVVLAGTMAVASATHRSKGAFAAKGGFELPLTNLAAALALSAAGPGRISIDGLTGARLPRSVTRLVVAGAVAASAASLAMVLRAPPPVSPSAEPVTASAEPVEDDGDTA